MNAGMSLRSARRRARMSQRELAAAAAVPQATVGRIEAGIVSPRADTLARLLRASGHELTVVPRLGEGVDRSLIRDRLRMTPEQRIRLAVEEARAMPNIRIRR
ncbi:MAG: helix-turn-helix domain-containing protein [Candidatus Limnocylindria bacterium]